MSAIMDNWLAVYEKRVQSPLYGKALVYLPGAEKPRAIPGSVVIDKIASCVMRDDLTEQYIHAAERNYDFIVLDIPALYNVGMIQEAITFAHGFGLGVIARNPKSLQIVMHPNVMGVIAERGVGTPEAYEELRKRARKDGLMPVWFVFADGSQGAIGCAMTITDKGLKGMGVSYSSGHYNDSHSMLIPTP